MKLVGDVRAVERAIGNTGRNAEKVEKRNFKIDVRPASKPDSYYGYGHMQFILHGRELEECGLDLGTKVSLYLVAEGQPEPDSAEFDNLRRDLYEAQNEVVRLEQANQQLKDSSARVERERFSAGEERTALRNENVRLTVELMTLKGATGHAPQPTMIEAQP